MKFPDEISDGARAYFDKLNPNDLKSPPDQWGHARPKCATYIDYSVTPVQEGVFKAELTVLVAALQNQQIVQQLDLYFKLQTCSYSYGFDYSDNAVRTQHNDKLPQLLRFGPNADVVNEAVVVFKCVDNVYYATLKVKFDKDIAVTSMSSRTMKQVESFGHTKMFSFVSVNTLTVAEAVEKVRAHVMNMTFSNDNQKTQYHSMLDKEIRVAAMETPRNIVTMIKENAAISANVDYHGNLISMPNIWKYTVTLTGINIRPGRVAKKPKIKK